jgi:hypothetical protein
MAYNKQVEDYIKNCTVSNIPKGQIVNSLVNAGWTQDDINDTFKTFNAPIVKRGIVSGTTAGAIGSVPEAPMSPRVITKKEYPVTVLWGFKLFIIAIFISIVALLFGYWFPELLLILPFLPIIYLYQRRKIKFSLSDNTINIAGVYKRHNKSSFALSKGDSKKGSISIPYSKISGVHTQQDVFDMIFGLSGVFVDLSQDEKKKKKSFIEKKLAPLFLGNVAYVQGDNFIIPGLTKKNAEILESIILDRMPHEQLLGSSVAVNN